MASTPRQPPRTFTPDNTTPRIPHFVVEGQTTLPPPPPYRDAPGEQSSLDITQKLERKLAHLNASENVFKRWLYEIISWTISALSMGAIVGILIYLNHQSLTKWPLGLTIIAVFSKIASAALILPTSEALGQLKWNWFNGKRSKQIWDFEIFDKASRGAWGSVLLLFRTKGRSLAALGALLTLLLLATDTFFQQVLDLPERWTLESTGSIGMVRWYEPDKDNTIETRNGVEITQLDYNLWPTAQKFFWDNGTQPVPFGNGTSPELPLNCPTSNCTWPTYETLGFCSSCVDLEVSDFLTFACINTRVDWIANLSRILLEDGYPNGTACGYWFNATSDSPILMSGYTTTAVNSSEGSGPANEALLMRAFPLVSAPFRKQFFNGSINFNQIRHPMTDVVIAASRDGAAGVYRNETPALQECVMYWCVKQVKSSYLWATYQEEVTSTFTNTTPGRFQWTVKRVDTEQFNGTDVTYGEDVIIQPPSTNGSGTTYGVSNLTQIRAYSIFDDVFPSFFTATNDTAKPIWRYKSGMSLVEKVPRYRVTHFNPWMSPNNVSRHMDRFATALTNRLRGSTSSEKVFGSAYSVETYVHVRWAWLAFPFAILILTLIFLGATMIKTTKCDGEVDLRTWKTSAMPNLIYGLPSPMQKQLTSSSRWSSASPDKSKNLRVRLHPKRGWRVSGQPYPSTKPVMVAPSNQPPPGWI